MYARSGLPPDDKSSYVTYNYIPAVCQVAPVSNLLWEQDPKVSGLCCELKGPRVPVSLATILGPLSPASNRFPLSRFRDSKPGEPLLISAIGIPTFTG